MTKIAVVGAGIIGRTHIELIMASDECELSAIADPSEAAAELARKHGVHYFDSLHKLLDRSPPDGVILATPNDQHVEQALLCIAAGIPVLIEKPVAHSLEDGERLLRAAASADAKCLVGHHRYHSPIIAKAREIIDEGTIGTPVAIAGSAMFYKPDNYFDQSPWRTRKGAGPILINLIHEVGNLRYMCGEIVEVQALAANARRHFEVEDTAAISLRFDNGALGSFMLSDTAACARSWEQTSRENTSYAHYPDEDCYVVAGTLGSLSIPTMRIKRYANAADRSWYTPFECTQAEYDRQDPLVRQLAHFLAVISGEAEPIASILDGLQNLRVIEAISEASRTKASVTIPSLH